MEIRLRCSNCDKDVLVDEAFAGGVCRCPHCKTTLSVPESGSARDGERPSRPEEQPRQPSEAPRTRRTSRSRSSRKMNRLILLMMMGVSALFLIAAGVMLYTYYGTPADDPEADAPWEENGPIDPTGGLSDETDGAAIAGLPIAGRVVYVIDAGSAMRQMYDYAAALTLRSIETLDEAQQYSIVLAREDGPQAMDGYHSPGPEGDEFLLAVSALGSTDIGAALNSAVGMDPDVIVLLTSRELDDPSSAAGYATGAGARLITIALDADASAEASLAQAAEAADGESRSFTRSQLDRWLRTAR